MYRFPLIILYMNKGSFKFRNLKMKEVGTNNRFLFWNRVTVSRKLRNIVNGKLRSKRSTVWCASETAQKNHECTSGTTTHHVPGMYNEGHSKHTRKDPRRPSHKLRKRKRWKKKKKNKEKVVWPAQIHPPPALESRNPTFPSRRQD